MSKTIERYTESDLMKKAKKEEKPMYKITDMSRVATKKYCYRERYIEIVTDNPEAGSAKLTQLLNDWEATIETEEDHAPSNASPVKKSYNGKNLDGPITQGQIGVLDKQHTFLANKIIEEYLDKTGHETYKNISKAQASELIDIIKREVWDKKGVK